jgi:tetratricopeptide (TPR) repeat protein
LGASLLAEPILVGREQELSKLDSYLNMAIAGKGVTVFVSGEAGSGKTRLTNEFFALAKKKGVRILNGWCLSRTAVPYFPFAEAFESYLLENEISSQSTQLLEALSPRTWLVSGGGEFTSQEEASPQAWNDQRFASVTQSLLFLSSQKPLVLFIDDLHWADSASLSLLQYITRLIGSERILILATFRSEELSAAVEGVASPLLDTLRRMGREGLFCEITLSNLSSPETGKIAESLLAGLVADDFVGKLFSESHGNPLFVIESLRMLFENQSLVQVDGVWCLATDKLGIPTKVKDIILRRLSGLKPSQRRILDVASVVGDKFDPQLIGAVLNVDSLEILEALNLIALSKSLVCVEGDFYRFDHAKSREVLYEEILAPLRKGYHARIAEKIEKLNEQTSYKFSLNDLAYHYTQAGELTKSIAYSLLAGKDALQRFSNAEAIKHFKYVIQTVECLADSFGNKAEALEGLGDALYAAGLFEEAAKTYESICNEVESKSLRLRGLRKAVKSCYWLGNSKHALELAEKAKEFVDVDRLEYARLRLTAGFVLGRSIGNMVEAIKEMNASISVFQEAYSVADIANGLSEISFIYSLQGNSEESLSSALRAVALQEQLNDRRQLAFALGRLGTALGTCSFFEKALEVLAKANELAMKVGDYNTIAFHQMMSGTYLEYMNKDEDAIAQSLVGLEAAEKTDARYIKLICHSNLTREYAKTGKTELAEEHYKEVANLFEHDPLLSGSINVRYNLDMCYVALLCSKKQWANACSILEKHLTPERIETKLCYTQILQALGRQEETKVQLKRLEELKKEHSSQFNRCNVKAFVLFNKHAAVNEEISLRLDIVNVGCRVGKLKQVIDIVPFVENVSLPPNVSFEDGSLIIDVNLQPFHDEVINLGVIPIEAGVYNVKPRIVYVDETGKKRVVMLEPVEIEIENLNTLIPSKNKPELNSEATQRIEIKSSRIRKTHFKLELDNNRKNVIFDSLEPLKIFVHPTASPEPQTERNEVAKLRFEFETKSAKEAFDFLIGSFVQDYMNRRLPLELSGWRTLMGIVKNTKISKRAVYSSKGITGPAISELKRRGLVEIRVFPGERGRGGLIQKVRVLYEKETIMRLVDERVMKSGKKN